MMATLKFPPWGVLSRTDADVIAADTVPAHWGRFSPAPAWEAFLDGVIDELAEFLWPRFDARTGSWRGAAAATAEALTDADFELLDALAPSLEEPIKGRGQTSVTHFDFYVVEDRGNWGGNEYVAYDPVLDPKVRAALPGLIDDSCANKSGTAALQVKQALLRPRPYQVAALQKRWDFRHRMAASAGTPAMVGGHTQQAALAGCHVASVWKPNGTIDATSRRLLGQLTCDIGDRRVFAGLHFPSDILGGWYLALKMIPHVFELPDDATAFLWQALTTSSSVYAAIHDHAATAGSPFAQPLQRLQALTPAPSSLAKRRTRRK